MDNMLICQSSGMNINDSYKGTNRDGSLSVEFCSFCFAKGEFINDVTLDEMVDIGLNFSLEYKNVQTQAKEYLSALKRWNSTNK